MTTLGMANFLSLMGQEWICISHWPEVGLLKGARQTLRETLP